MMDRLLIFNSRQRNIIVVALFVFCLVLHTPANVFAQDKGQVIPSPKDFIEKNLKEFNEELEKLKKLYQNEHGSLLLDATSPVEPKAIAEQLPKSTTLTLSIEYPVRESRQDKKLKDRGAVEYFLNAVGAYTFFDPVYNHGPKSFGPALEKGKFETDYLVAADTQTSQLLGLPNEIGLEIMGDVMRRSKTEFIDRVPQCCIKVQSGTECVRTSLDGEKCEEMRHYEYCGEYFPKPMEYYDSTGPLKESDKERFGLSVQSSLGASVSGMKKILFSDPGKKSVKVISKRRFPDDKSKWHYKKCEPKHSGVEKVEDGYLSLETTSDEKEFTAVKFIKFGFPGYQLGIPPGRQIDEFDNFDHFFGSDQATRNPSGEIAPCVLLDFGNAGGLKTFNVFKVKNLPVELRTVKAGPFFITNNGFFEYRGGYGDTHFQVSLGKYETIDGMITANLVEVVPDDIMSKFKVSLGKNHKVLVHVDGSADMSKYHVKWTSDAGKWSKNISSFKKVGKKWQTEGIFTVDSKGAFQLSLIDNPVKIAISVVRTADNKEVYLCEKRFLTTHPPVNKLELFAGIGNAPPDKVTEPIDLFISSNTSRVEITPRFFIKEGEAYTAREIASTANIEVSSSSPAIIGIVPHIISTMNLTKLFAEAAGKTGTAKVVARMGDSVSGPKGIPSIANGKSELISNTVEINVNDAYLVATPSSGGITKYKLIVSGPANMSKYQAKWSGEATRTTSFSKDGNGYATTLDTTLRVDRVEIEKTGKTFAQFNVKSVAKELDVKLIPSTPPVTVVKKVDVSDLGSLETITECKKNVSHLVEYFGFNPGMAIEDYCRTDREKQKQEIKADREEQKAFNKMVSDINKQGQDLVVVSDTMRVGAAIKGNFTYVDNEVVCFWSLQNNANLELQSQVTPIEKVGADEGACFNIVKGLKGGFNPDTVLKIDLVMLPKPEIPVVRSNEKAILSGTGFW